MSETQFAITTDAISPRLDDLVVELDDDQLGGVVGAGPVAGWGACDRVVDGPVGGW